MTPQHRTFCDDVVSCIHLLASVLCGGQPAGQQEAYVNTHPYLTAYDSPRARRPAKRGSISPLGQTTEMSKCLNFVLHVENGHLSEIAALLKACHLRWRGCRRLALVY